MPSKTYNIKERENHWREFWEKEKIYQFNLNSKKPFYSVDTPPPYVSAAHLHVGHIMSYSQAEFIVRFKRMSGFEVYYPMGFDDNGLPTERFVEKKYKINKKTISRDEFVKKCLEETKIGSRVYKTLWQLLGISVDWTKTYSTINPHSQRISQWSFCDLYKKGKMLRKEEPIPWCPFCQTALAQADLEDKEEKTFLNYIRFKSEKGENLLIATTRPELLPACVALFVNPADKRYKELIGEKATVPIFKQEVPILADDKVDMELGTGLMMVCTWGDQEDVRKSKEHNLESRIVIKPDGTLGKLAGEFADLKITEAREKIITKLKEAGYLQKQEETIRSIPIHERCETPVEFVKTKQWFCDVLNIKKDLLKQADKMNWHPLSMKQKYIDWVNGLKWDWCISRQRYYGVPFPVWYCEKCEKVILPAKKDLPIDPTLQKPRIKKCPKCKGEEFVPEKDVMDTWMTSSLTPLIGAGLVKEKGVQEKLYPATLRPQAFEIIRTWLFYTVVKSLYHHNTIPFTDIMISGHGLDPQGRKIAKRLGNYEPAEDIIEKYGADSLRYWATGATLGSNLRYSENEVKKGKRTVIKLFNAANFCFSHFKDKGHSKLNPRELQSEDKWILHNLSAVIKKTTEYFDNYHYSKAKDEIDNFFWHVFCDNYLEFVKHRLYGEKPDETAKAVLYRCLVSIIKMYSPLMPYITEELYQAYFRKFEKEKSVHLASWPQAVKNLSIDKNEIGEFNGVLSVINEIRAYKSNRQISLGKEIKEYKTSIPVPKEYAHFIKEVGRVKKLIVG